VAVTKTADQANRLRLADFIAPREAGPGRHRALS